MWLREKDTRSRVNNIVCNDPKGELLTKFYVRSTVRGFQVVQFNLINPLKTDIYNPLGMAADSAREGDFTKCAQYVENIAEVFFRRMVPTTRSGPMLQITRLSVRHMALSTSIWKKRRNCA